MAVSNVKKFDFAMLHSEFLGFIKLRNDIVAKFTNVNSYKEVLNQYCAQIESF